MTDEMLGTVAEMGRAFDLMFHDADHSGDSYVGDFGRVLPVLKPGAVVVFDDIRWQRDASARPLGSSPQMDCHAGWLRVTEHPRVRRAVEVDRSIGIVLLD
jgi:predicted O-methyltransferase YrrM